MAERPRRRRLGPPGPVRSLLVAAVALLLAVVVFWLVAMPGSAPLLTRPALRSLELGLGARREVAPFERAVAARLAAVPVSAKPVTARIQVSARNIVWQDRENRRFLDIPSARGWLNPRAVKRARFELHDVVVDSPSVLLAESSSHAWNYVPVLGLDQPSPVDTTGSPESGVFVNDTRIVGGTVQTQLVDSTYVLSAIDADVPDVEVPGAGRPSTIALSRVTGTLAPPTARPLALTLSGASLSFPRNQVTFALDHVQLGQTVLTHAQGTWGANVPGYGINGSGVAEQVRLADLRFIDDRMPDEGTARFDWSVMPAPGGTALVVHGLSVNSMGSRVSGRLDVLLRDSAAGGGMRLDSVDLRANPLSLALVDRFAPRPIPYAGDVRASVVGSGGRLRFSGDALLQTKELKADTGTVHFDGAATMDEGVVLDSVHATLHSLPLQPLGELLPGALLAGAASGSVVLRGSDPRTLAVRANLDMADGAATVEGTVSREAEPDYALHGRLIDIDVHQLLRPRLPAVRLSAEFTAQGHGLTPDSARAVIGVSGGLSGWYTAAHDTLQADITVGDGLMRVGSALLSAGPVSFTAHGDWGLRSDVVAKGLDYTVEVTSLAPLTPYLGLPSGSSAGGSLSMSGTATGTLQRPVMNGRLRADEVEYGAWAANTVTAQYQVALGDSIPALHVDASARGVDTQGFGAFEAASASLALTNPTFKLQFTADRLGAGVVQLQADGKLGQGGERTATLQQLAADLGDEHWTLRQPATVDWGGPGGVSVDDLVVAAPGGDHHLQLAGHVWPLRQADFSFDLAGLPAGSLQQMLGREPVAEGVLSAKGRFRGGDVPAVQASFVWNDGRVEDVHFTRFAGSVGYADDTASVHAMAALQPTGQIRLDAHLPVLVRLAAAGDTVRWEGQSPLLVTLKSDSLPLSLLDPLIPEVRSLQGAVVANVHVAGTPDHPDFGGSVTLGDGAVTVPALQQRFEHIAGALALQGQTLRVVDLTAHSDGSATLSGTVTFQSLSRPVADLKLAMTRFRVMGGLRNQQPAGVWGTLTVTGPVRTPALGGQLTVNDGYVKVPEIQSDQSQQQVEQFMATGGIATANLQASTAPGPVSAVAINDLRVTAGDNLWFVMPDARAQLAGTLRLRKSGNEFRIYGVLSGEHGTFTLRAGPLIRRFDLQNAEIRFFGAPQPNPGLQITASRVVYTPDGQIDVLANVGGTAQRPTLTFATSEGAQIPESELLSFLLFGQPSFALGGQAGGQGVGQTLFRGTLVGGIVDLFSMGLEQTIVQQLGVPLDYFQLRVNEAGTGTAGGQQAGLLGLQPSVVVGKAIGNNVFLTVDAGIGTLFGEAGTNAVGASVEWRLTPQWTLQAGLEPLIRQRLSMLGIEVLSPLTNPGRQATLDLRRRWTY